MTTFDKTITSFNDFQVHEINSENLIQSGREWYGERFGIIDKYLFGFNFPNLNTSSPVFVKTSVAARSLNSSSFSISANGNFLSNINVSKLYMIMLLSMLKAGLSSNQFLSNSDQINIEIEYNYSSNAIGWLNYIELNARRDLRINNDFLHFRDLESITTNQSGKYIISNANSLTKVWDITDVTNVRSLSTNFPNNEIIFLDSISELKTYYAFNQDYKKTVLVGENRKSKFTCNYI